MSRWGRKRKYDLSKMSDEEFNDFMDFCENSDEEIEGDDFDSDNDVNDPDFVVPNQNDSFLQETANNISVSDLSLSRGIYSLGTFRVNRVKNCKLSADEQLVVKKAPRGYLEDFVATAFGVDISTVVWKDSKPVRLASTYAGVQPFNSNNPSDRNTLSRRYNRNRKQYEYVSCPNIVKEYNRHMGGVDLMGSLIGHYKIRMKTRKWPSRIFHHVIDLAIVNAFVLYHRINREKCQRVELPRFREEIAETLLLISETKKFRRNTTAEKQAEEVPNGSKLLYLPPPNIRYDCLNHWPNFCDKSSKLQCRNTPCKSETQVYCEKCNIPLCMSVKKSCFKEFHAE
ncbi:piggyBac transposable element-derived protein 3-like [Anastrepha obliqua]|uniref:piggyBac transposable element-derived protein 3-like n=1 Tax=Anastrepha obliqua TaxID=95512 RepID=UPI002408F9CA|nr:piggyBac transposable element-derived protein 3-like [Anastrepha obliqua]